MWKICVVCVFLGILRSGNTCGQFNVKLDYIRNCGINNVVVVDGITARTDKSCNLFFTGRADVKRSFRYAKFSGTVAGQKFASEFCTIASLYKPAQQVLNVYGFPKQCPIPGIQGYANASKLLNISKYRRYLRLLIGTFTSIVNVDHDTGTSCFELSVTINKT